MENMVRLRYWPKRGTMREKSGVMGFTVNMKPTWRRFEARADMTATRAMGKASFQK